MSGSTRSITGRSRKGGKIYAAIRRYWPDLRDGFLALAYSGVRPKLRAPGEPAADFVISAEDHGLAGLVNLFGIESPGLTASLSIAEGRRGQTPTRGPFFTISSKSPRKLKG